MSWLYLNKPFYFQRGTITSSLNAVATARHIHILEVGGEMVVLAFWAWLLQTHLKLDVELEQLCQSQGRVCALG